MQGFPAGAPWCGVTLLALSPDRPQSYVVAYAFERTAPQRRSMTEEGVMRVSHGFFLAGIAATLALAGSCPLVAQGAAKRTVEVSGLLLANGFYNTNETDNPEVPLFVPPRLPRLISDVRSSGGGGTIRQSRFGVHLIEPRVLGGTLTGDLDIDLFGDQVGNSRPTFPTPRIRRLAGGIKWQRAELLVGQESPLVAEVDPRSLASVGVPGFVTAGNLWFWTPQVRASYEIGRSLRLALQGAMLAPATPTVQGGFNREPDLAQQSARPFLQGRVRLSWGPQDDASELAVGVHQGWFALTRSTLTTSRALTVTGHVKLRTVELRGEWYKGYGLATLGGGGIDRDFARFGEPLNDTGGWTQLNLMPSSKWELGVGCGLDQPDRDQLDTRNDYVELKNVACEGHIVLRPGGSPVVGVEFRRLETTYGGSTGALVNSHLNVQMGFQF